MQFLKDIPLEGFDYVLPPEKIARYPLERRDQSKLLIFRDGKIEDRVFGEIPGYLPAGSHIIFNDTRVVRARVLFRKDTGAVVEVFCLEPVEPSADVEMAFGAKGRCLWRCYIGNLKRWKKGDLLKSIDLQPYGMKLYANYRGSEGDAFLVEFRWEPSTLTFSEVLEAAGQVPLPPYIDRDPEEADSRTYQTVYASHDGSVAAPTAGLHFTPEVLAALKERRIEMDYLSLHVGAGTFKPVVTPSVLDHEMHVEQVSVDRNIIEKLAVYERPVVAVGTTSLRTLESLYWFGQRLLAGEESAAGFTVSQWEPYAGAQEQEHDRKAAMGAILGYMDRNNLTRLHGSTQVMILPGYRFRVTDGLVTNFHLPKSTLLLLIAAFIGEEWKDVYAHALNHGYRFLSYGDCCLFFRR